MDMVREFLQLPEGDGEWRSELHDEFDRQCTILDGDNMTHLDDYHADFGGWLLGQVGASRVEIDKLKAEKTELVKMLESTVEWLDRGDLPVRPNHICGPEGNCDCDYQAHAQLGTEIYEMRVIIIKAKEEVSK